VDATDVVIACTAIEQGAGDRNMAGSRSAIMALWEAIRQFETYLVETEKYRGKDESQ
jgi:hypothetical protein